MGIVPQGASPHGASSRQSRSPRRAVSPSPHASAGTTASHAPSPVGTKPSPQASSGMPAGAQTSDPSRGSSPAGQGGGSGDPPAPLEPLLAADELAAPLAAVVSSPPQPTRAQSAAPARAIRELARDRASSPSASLRSFNRARASL